MHLYSATSRIVSLGLSGSVVAARQLFDRMPARDVVAWNAMLSCYSRSGLPLEALVLFRDMTIFGMRPDAFSLTAALSSSAEARDVRSGRMLHALVCTLGHRPALPVCNALVDMYGKCRCHLSAAQVFHEMEEHNEVSWCSLLSAYVGSGQLVEARHLFDEIPSRNSVAWNVLLGGYVHSGDLESAVVLFKEMLASGFMGDLWTYSAFMSGCSGLKQPHLGYLIHAVSIKVGWSSAVEVSNSVMSFYAKLGCAPDAQKIFDAIPARTHVSWNTMADAHMRAADIDGALSVFWRSPERSTVSWTAVIGGLARNGREDEALHFFVRMIGSNLRPDGLTFGSALHACAGLAVLEHGRMIHGCVLQSGFDTHLYAANGLVNMYAKCGDIGASACVFRAISHKDSVSWNTMLLGLAMNGRAPEVLGLYGDMVTHAVPLDAVTFIALLTACSHSGLVEQAGSFFRMMSSVHGVPPGSDHLVCAADMLGRAGWLEEAHGLLRGTDSCKALLRACSVHGDAEMGKKVAEGLIRDAPLEEEGYVMLSNIYCSRGRWKEAEKVRKAMCLQGLRKQPGCSWVEVRNTVEVFTCGALSHVMGDALYAPTGLLAFDEEAPTAEFIPSRLSPEV